MICLIRLCRVCGLLKTKSQYELVIETKVNIFQLKVVLKYQSKLHKTIKRIAYIWVSVVRVIAIKLYKRMR